MSAEAFLKRSLRQVGTLSLVLSLIACGGLPDWSDAPGADGPGAIQDDWTFPDLAQLPAPTDPPPSAAAHSDAVQSLEAARLQNQRAGENLGSEIENNFEYPTASNN